MYHFLSLSVSNWLDLRIAPLKRIHGLAVFVNIGQPPVQMHLQHIGVRVFVIHGAQKMLVIFTPQEI